MYSKLVADLIGGVFATEQSLVTRSLLDFNPLISKPEIK